jgi:hypothetical protein
LSHRHKLEAIQTGTVTKKKQKTSNGKVGSKNEPGNASSGFSAVEAVSELDPNPTCVDF